MFLRTWRFITITLAALSSGMAFCHALELPAKLKYDAALWVSVQHTLYRAFGVEGVGAWIEAGAVLAAVVLPFLVRQNRLAFWWTLAGTACFVVAHAIWWMFVFPANAQVAQWTPGAVPTDWTRWRDQWEYTHAIRFGLMLAGLCAFVLSVLVETPRTYFDDGETSPRTFQDDRAHATR
jgi:hypothetical protein